MNEMNSMAIILHEKCFSDPEKTLWSYGTVFVDVKKSLSFEKIVSVKHAVHFKATRWALSSKFALGILLLVA